ncbi:isochorismatase family protein [Aggregatimonas sangjinii]|uniref:Isochorismatase family protein n=1 Tax=Aggregatimonas sangjinii TaxID=2583587 RepID=A0A5B7SLX6_9FLAO|nr:isochorismatase family protein [Aggregatimonas sangjinii]QCW99456.1 isochorismatase family protein [Aggregatimonas sangjinii]
MSNDIKIERHTASAWGSKPFRDAIEKFGKKKIVIGGISIDICTQLTTLDLLANGYEVYVVVDASGTDQPIVEQAAMMRMQQAGATMITWGTLASELMVDWKTPEGPKVGKLYQEHSAWGGFQDAYAK